MPSRSEPGTSSPTGIHGPGADGDGIEVGLELLERDVAPDAGIESEAHTQPLDQPDVHLDRLARQSEGGHADEHRAAGEGQLVEDRDLVAGRGQLASDRDAGRSGADDGDLRVLRRDDRHLVRDARRLVPLDEEALHGPDGQRPVDVAPPAGSLTGRGADVGAHGGHRVGLAREHVALLEAAFGSQVQVATTVGADRAGFLALDVALKPGRIDGLDEEVLVDSHGQVRRLSDALGGEVGGLADRPESTIPNVPHARSGGRSGPRRWPGSDRSASRPMVRLTPRVVAATLRLTMRAAQPGSIRIDR